MKLSSEWKSRKLWVFIGISSIAESLATFLLTHGRDYPVLLNGHVVLSWRSYIDMATWQSITTMLLTVGLGIFVVGNLGEKWINGKNGKN